uniref:Uncharacterized protein n=1 Tax=Kalanchoe fedtschenkoi TaxID=63787 RepID=A0A7N0V1V4_KALFE
MAAVKSRSRRAAHHFLMCLALCCLLSAVLAAPASRSLKPVEAYSSIQDTAAVTQVRGRWTRLGEGGTTEIELTDYPGPGANKGHEPVTPPRR